MFDNIKDPNSPISSDAQKKSPPPPNIPLSSAGVPVEDIFSDSLRDKSQVSGAERPPLMTQTNVENFKIENYDSGHRDKKKLLLLLSIFIGVILVGFGAYFVFARIVKNINQLKENSDSFSTGVEKEAAPVLETEKEVKEVPVQTPAVVAEKNADVTTASSTVLPVEVPNDTTVNDTAPVDPLIDSSLEPISTSSEMIDTDKDGLTDVEEKNLLTSPINIDSDGDGLNDFEEVRKYKTDPLKADTDADGFNDGEEVKAGYNPKGEGRLIK